MSLNVRLLIIIAVGAIVAVSCFAVYSMLGGDNAAGHKELGSLDNYKAATELKAPPAIHFLDGNRKDIRNAVEAAFKVKVAEVRTSTTAGKLRRRGKFAGYRADWKKAYVRLKAGEKMPEYAEI